MFKPETEDMLPRMAPKPSGSSLGATELIVRPQVPEVSILFGQQANNLQPQNLQTNVQQAQQQTTSYAAWKKQMLPKVSFPAGLMQEGSTTSINNSNNTNSSPIQTTTAARSNLYPLRNSSSATATTTTSAGGISNGYGVNNPVSYATPPNSIPNCVYTVNGVVGNNPTAYRNNLESPCTYQPIQQQQQQILYRKSMEMTPPTAPSPRDVLTICAGTQTDAMSSPVSGQQNIPQNVATKKDIEEIKLIVQEMRHDQLYIMQMMEKFLSTQQIMAKSKMECKDVGIQVNINNMLDNVPAANGLESGAAAQIPLQPTTNKIIQQLKPSPNALQTPKGKPVAQSTAYRPNSPQSNRLQEYQQVPPPSSTAVQTQPAMNYLQWNQQIAAALPKPTTDKSLIMNELALKYLPREKLAELLNDLTLSPDLGVALKQVMQPSSNTPSTPLQNIENFERSPSDISNASYKYLKKYRLLPEDNIADAENENPVQYNGTPPNLQYVPLPSPIQQRPIPISNAPIGRLPQSPLARVETGSSNNKNNMLDLDNIKLQPKFL
ncbi:uncharacterized protein LOC106080839 [Stomoxys calcitrans]|uniref:uncharacterized protein LOC106080839 n=1 Tax=Stomoxys calcitrans TaxID=35570 RepID=UPI0027E308CB|nr:uncharacterized protein LOC106080839 [Stomoxys calcitrans]